MSEDYCRLLLEDYLKSSWSTVKVLVEKLGAFGQEKHSRQVTLFRYVNGQKVQVQFGGDSFFLRGSVEYTNPQLTVEEVQGIIATGCLKRVQITLTKLGCILLTVAMLLSFMSF